MGKIFEICWGHLHADIFVYQHDASDYNEQLPLYHVCHPLALRKGMDRDAWSLCVPTGK